MIENILNELLIGWMSEQGEHSDIVLSSRIRLARNLKQYAFPSIATDETLEKVAETIALSLPDLNKDNRHSYQFIELSALSDQERSILVEKHLISPKHIEKTENRALLLRDDVAVSIMINEEDHLRIQSIVAGLGIQRAFAEADHLDDILEQRQDFAFHPEIGYLTACPTNVGTGMRASVILHLPALVLLKRINRIVQGATKLGFYVRGLYGKGTDTVGNIFQISNQITLGISEDELLLQLQKLVLQVIKEEEQARSDLLLKSKDALTDRLWRAYGILSYAYMLSSQEALSLISDMRLGIDLGLITNENGRVFNELLVLTRPSCLQQYVGKKNIPTEERNILRAAIVRKKIREYQSREE
jgi:protein arginine kinase